METLDATELLHQFVFDIGKGAAIRAGNHVDVFDEDNRRIEKSGRVIDMLYGIFVGYVPGLYMNIGDFLLVFFVYVS